MFAQDPITIFFIVFYTIILSMIAFFAYSFWRSRAVQQTKKIDASAKHTPIKISSHDINAIAGEDKLATQLDLARAYIESGRKQLAKNILADVSERGDQTLQAEAERLMRLI